MSNGSVRRVRRRIRWSLCMYMWLKWGITAYGYLTESPHHALALAAGRNTSIIGASGTVFSSLNKVIYISM